MGKAPILPSGHLCVTFTKNLLMDPQPANPIPPKTGRNLSGLGAAAQRAAVRLLAVICASATRHLLQQLLPDTAGLRCLHWGCGSGEETFLLSSLLTEESSWWAIDEDPVLIEAALQQEARHSGASVHFAQSFHATAHWQVLGQCRHSCVRRNAAVQRWTAAVRCVRVWEIFKFEVWFSGDVKGRYLCRLGRVGFLATLAASRPWQFSRQFSQASIVFDTRAEAVHLHLRQIVTVEP